MLYRTNRTLTYLWQMVGGSPSVVKFLFLLLRLCGLPLCPTRTLCRGDSLPCRGGHGPSIGSASLGASNRSKTTQNLQSGVQLIQVSRSLFPFSLQQSNCFRQVKHGSSRQAL